MKTINQILDYLYANYTPERIHSEADLTDLVKKLRHCKMVHGGKTEVNIENEKYSKFLRQQ
jgi:hypothetical protein